MYNANNEEQKILEFWSKDQTFEKSVKKDAPKGPYVFYDGPPFATGLPHYGHIVASTMKDVVPRYFTMQGYQVERRWGWDCHGLPIENIVEKELGTKTKKEVEAMGVDKFNELCRSKVLGYVEEWEKTINRLGRWVDMKNSYRTMDRDFMESVWWVFKQLWDKNLIYEDYRSMHICPRCETTLSQQEVSEGYKDVKDISVTVKFRIKNDELRIKELSNATFPLYILAWTTTPWTLPGNVALAVGNDLDYVLIRKSDMVSADKSTVASADLRGKVEYCILAKVRWEKLKIESKDFQEFVETGHEFKGKDLVGLTYEPLFPFYKDTKNAFRVVAGDFVTTEDGTGVVHIAPGFGDDDFKVGKREQIPLVQHVGMDGRFKAELGAPFAGMEVKPKNEDDKVRLAADIAILKYLQENNLFFSKQNLVHSYPHCWRCDSPLLNYATSSWFVKVLDVKEKALKNAKQINWSPEHIKEGRFGKWLEGARDWSISRQRFWASVMPVWQCSDCKKFQVFGNVADLEKASGQTVTDLHKHIVDKITFACSCGGTFKRIPDVLDTWFDSGSMPYAQVHYPFENKAKFEGSFPAEFIAEGQDQTRAWFYYLHVLATGLFDKIAFKNVIVNGIVLAEDGKKMSKKLQNYPDPNEVLAKYGADALRFYLLSSPVMEAEALNFSEAGVREVFSKVVNTLYNVVEFYQLFVPILPPQNRGSAIPPKRNRDEFQGGNHVLDKWVLAKLQVLVNDVTKNMNEYKLVGATRPIADFITELSQWYVRRSRDRFKSDDVNDKAAALATLKEVLSTLAKLMAPFMPFMAEKVWQVVGENTHSVHLEKWPTVTKAQMNTEVLQQMDVVRKVVELGLAARAEAGVKVRQALGWFAHNQKLDDQLNDIVKDELNVKEVNTKHKGATVDKSNGPIETQLDTTITEELKKEGLVREVVRTVNQMRKDLGFTIQDRAVVEYATDDADLVAVFTDFGDEIKRQTLTDKIVSGGEGAELALDGKKVRLSVKKV